MSRDQVFETLVRRKPAGTLADAAPALYEKVALFFRQAGLGMSPQRFVVILAFVSAGVGVGGVFLLSMITRGAVITNLLISAAGAVGLVFLGGWIWLARRRAARLRKLEEQLPLALDITVRALRAGHPLVTAVKLASDEMADPIGSEFGLIVDETTYGLEFREALASFAARTSSEYVNFFAVSVSIQSETGGNLAEILGNLCSVIRNMQTLHLRVKALSSEGRTSAQVLTGLPIALVCFLMLVQPTFYTTKLDDPIFWPSVAVVMVMYFIGQFIINRMVNFKY
jgi:tight adherence protein B